MAHKYVIFGWKRRGPHLQKKSGGSDTRDGAIRKARELTNDGFRVQICDGKQCRGWPTPGLGTRRSSK